MVVLISAPTTWAGSRLGWRRRRRGCGGREWRSRAVDLSRGPLDPALAARASMVAFYLPMHTATRLALPVMDRLRALNPAIPLCAYGLYAPLNEELLRAHGVTHVLGPEAEADSWSWCTAALARLLHGCYTAAPVPRLTFVQPDRSGSAAAVEVCVAADARWHAAGGGGHRGDARVQAPVPALPNRPGVRRAVPRGAGRRGAGRHPRAGGAGRRSTSPSAIRISSTAPPTRAASSSALHAEWPALTYDVTIKVEHLLRPSRAPAACWRAPAACS